VTSADVTIALQSAAERELHLYRHNIAIAIVAISVASTLR
jgi:hypothetical protein